MHDYSYSWTRLPVYLELSKCFALAFVRKKRVYDARLQ